MVKLESPLPEGKLAAAARGSKLLKNEGSCNSIICNIGQQDHGKKRDISQE